MKLIEEFMLTANVLVAEFITPLCGSKAILRAHADMGREGKQELDRFFMKIGMPGLINLSTPRSLYHSIEDLRAKTDEKSYNVL
jgi:exoribonuclease R